ncbi:MAG TPA: glycosyltransferase family 2 protein [Candidatus Saccharimonadales bacterium]
MTGFEIPLGKRSRQYRFFEMLPGIMSWGALIILIVLAVVSPLLCAVYLLLIFATTLMKAVGVAYHTLRGSKRLNEAQKLNWRSRLDGLEDPSAADLARFRSSNAYFDKQYVRQMERLVASRETYPKPSEIYNAVIIPMYNETFEVLDGTVQEISRGSYENKHLIIVIAYEERGGEAGKEVAKRIKEKYKDVFYELLTVMHPKNLPNEVIGKGGNITFAGRQLQEFLNSQKLGYEKVIVTTLDSDNRPHREYFSYVTYEYIIHPGRKRLSFQPISLFLNNIWDVPAPMRVVATGNSFWNIISAMRPHTLRNFASHSQPMDALVEMQFWSTRTIVEDGHQYWRSYIHFKGSYDTVAIFVPIYQDAVLSDTYVRTLKAQFVQLRRWAYGASDVPYVAVQLFTRKRQVPFWAGFTRLVRLIDGHVTLASVPLLVAFGGWVPLLLNSEATRSVAANQLPEVLGVMQRCAMVGLVITVFLGFKMLPPRPARYKRRRTVGMLAQWVLMPVTSIAYSAVSAYYSQTRLLIGNYMTKFDVTDKAVMLATKDGEIIDIKK